ncbi:TNF receptor-associated factor-like protein 1a [Bienertia sinuspersici]
MNLINCLLYLFPFLAGPKPSELYGKYTWKIDRFSQIEKKELRSNAFEVGGYRWYILTYPQGCDACNHLSLFLCVANHDKLLPGWSHFAEFTFAVVNKDPKKSKYSGNCGFSLHQL